MTENLLHPTPDRLEALVENTLDTAERAVLESHLLGCPRCQADVEEWRALFATLAALPHYAPAPGFAARVMAGVRVPQPWRVRAAAVLQRLVPNTTMGWALVAAIVALPAFTIAGGLAWLLSRPLITPLGLWLFLRDTVIDAASAFGAQLWQALSGLGTEVWLFSAIGQLLQAAGPGQLGAAVAAFGLGTMASAWILYLNLIRTKRRGTGYVSYAF